VPCFERHEISLDGSAHPGTKLSVGTANAFDDYPGRSEGAASKGAIIRRWRDVLICDLGNLIPPLETR